MDLHEREVWVYSVDTHDGIGKLAGTLSEEDAAKWKTLVDQNRALKRSIESALGKAGYLTPVAASELRSHPRIGLLSNRACSKSSAVRQCAPQHLVHRKRRDGFRHATARIDRDAVIQPGTLPAPHDRQRPRPGLSAHRISRSRWRLPRRLRQHPDQLRRPRTLAQARRDGGQSDAINQGMREARAATSSPGSTPMTCCGPAPSRRSSPIFALIPTGTSSTATRSTSTRTTACSATIRRPGTISSVCCNHAASVEPAAFRRRSVLERVGLLDDTLHFAMDYDYSMRIDRAGCKLVHVPEHLACSRLYPETKTLSARMEVYREILAVSRRHVGDASFSQYYAYWHHRCHDARAVRRAGCVRCPNVTGGSRICIAARIVCARRQCGRR